MLKLKFGLKKFVKLIYLISRVFLAWTFLNFLAHSAPDDDKNCPGCIFLETLYVYDCGFNDQTIKELVIKLTNHKDMGYKEMGKVLKKLYKSGYHENFRENNSKLRFTHINNMGAKVRKTSVPGLRCKKNMINAIKVLCPQVTNLKVRVQDSDVQHLSCLQELRCVELLYNCGRPLTPALGNSQSGGPENLKKSRQKNS